MIRNRQNSGRRSFPAVLFLAAAILFAMAIPAGLVSGLTRTAPEGPSLIRLSWTADPETTMTVTWQDATDTQTAWIEYAEGNTLADSIGQSEPAEASMAYLVQRADIVEHQSLLSDGGTQWTAELTGLKPGTGYSYRVCGSRTAAGTTEQEDEVQSAAQSSGVFHFTTEAESTSDTVSFAYFGDVQVNADAEGEYTRWGQMAQDAYFRNPDIAFGIMGGDIVESGISTEQFDQFFDAAAPVFSSIPLFSTIGNHESNFLSGKPELYLDCFAFPRNGPENFEEEFYSFDYGPAHIQVLNSWVYSGEQKMSDEDYERIRDWIRDDLEDVPENAWKIIIMHHPLYPVHTDRVAAQVKEQWGALLEEGGADLLLCGHQHVYCRSLPLTGGLADYENGITQVMGVSGEKFYSSADEFNMERTVYEVSNYQIIRVQGESLELQCFDRDGNELDYATLSRSGSGSDDPDEPGAERFRDVSAEDWFFRAVDFVSRKGYFNGTSETEFSPGLTMTRAMFVTVLGRMAGAEEALYTGSDFTDVAEGRWYSAYVKWASQHDIVNGIGGVLFDPDGSVTREQMAAIMFRYAAFCGLNTDADDARFLAFTDRDQVSAYARDAMIWAVDRGIINGTGTGLEPKAKATRAQVAQIIMNYTEKTGNQ